MHQSRFSPSQSRYVLAYRSGKNFTRPPITALIATSARPIRAVSSVPPSDRSPIRTNHWSDRYGSIGVLLRSLYFIGTMRSFLPT